MRLQLFAACEKIITATDGTLSLITLLERMHVNIPPDVQVAESSSAPTSWMVLAVWRPDPSDAGRTYEQYAEVQSEAGITVLRTETRPIEVSPGPHRVVSKLLQFPISFGNLTLKQFMREAPDGTWNEVAQYPIEVALTRDE